MIRVFHNFPIIYTDGSPSKRKTKSQYRTVPTYIKSITSLVQNATFHRKNTTVTRCKISFQPRKARFPNDQKCCKDKQIEPTPIRFRQKYKNLDLFIFLPIYRKFRAHPILPGRSASENVHPIFRNSPFRAPKSDDHRFKSQAVFTNRPFPESCSRGGNRTLPTRKRRPSLM